MNYPSDPHWCTYCNGVNNHNCQFNPVRPRVHLYAGNSTAPSVTDTLPPLPPQHTTLGARSIALFTADQMREYAAAAVAAETERLRHNNRVLTDALWKACGDDDETVNATIESQGELR